MSPSGLDILVIDDMRTFAFAAVYARTAAEGLTRLQERAWREVWLDHDLGQGTDIKPVVEFLEERASTGQPLDVGLIYVHTSDAVAGDAMELGLRRWYRVRRAVAHAFLPEPDRASAPGVRRRR